MRSQSIPQRAKPKPGEPVVECEVYTRIVGYLRPTRNYAQHKKDEVERDRLMYIPPSMKKLKAMVPQDLQRKEPLVEAMGARMVPEMEVAGLPAGS